MRTAAVLAALLAACASTPSRGPVTPVPDEAVAAARCERGLPAECRALGRMRLSADPAARDDRLAASLLTQACEAGDPAACGDLGALYAIGRGVAQSDDRAVALSRRACEQGAAIACSNLGALLAAGVAAAEAQEPADARASRILRQFRTACDAGVPEGCANLGTALDAGRIAVRDVRTAARALRRACDAGFALGCQRLALLVGERPEVAPDLTATALQVRACRAGIAPSCFAVSENTPPETARTPAPRLVDERGAFALGIPGTGGFSAGDLASARPTGPRRTLHDLRQPPAAVQEAVPLLLRQSLGVDLPPRGGAVEDPPVDLLVAFRRHQLGQCYEAARTPGRKAEAFATFFVEGDGRTREVRAATDPPEPALETCVFDLVSEWEFPASPDGILGPYLVRHAYDPAPPGPPARFAGPGSLRPSPKDPACIERRLSLPAAYDDASGSLTVKLAVDAAGTPALVHALTPAPDPIVAAVAEAVRRCAWSPGADSDGRPAALWVTHTVRLDRR